MHACTHPRGAHLKRRSRSCDLFATVTYKYLLFSVGSVFKGALETLHKLLDRCETASLTSLGGCASLLGGRRSPVFYRRHALHVHGCFPSDKSTLFSYPPGASPWKMAMDWVSHASLHLCNGLLLHWLCGALLCSVAIDVAHAQIDLMPHAYARPWPHLIYCAAPTFVCS